MIDNKPMLRVGNNILIAICICVISALIVVESVAHSNNKRDIEIESLKIEKQHKLEVTKQKAIEHDKSRKRKTWEREMTPEDNK